VARRAGGEAANERLARRVVEVVNKNGTLDPKINQALSNVTVVDITTKGRKSGTPRRLEIVSHPIGGKLYISGMPFENRRSWLANLDADPHFTLHVKGQVKADLPATARIITDESERRDILTHIAKTWKRKDVDLMVAQSPLIEVKLDAAAA
jgi:deazaflavin-dependent oxidoreductase (nitroreductase family)